MLALGLVTWGLNKSGIIQVSLSIFVEDYITTPTPQSRARHAWHGSALTRAVLLALKEVFAQLCSSGARHIRSRCSLPRSVP